MRQNSLRSTNNLHWHDGSTCHGYPTLQECLASAVENHWVGKVLQREDIDGDDKKVQCFSLIASSFDHWKKYGTFVAVVEVTARLL